MATLLEKILWWQRDSNPRPSDSCLAVRLPHNVCFYADRFKIGSRGEICAIEPLELRFPLETVFSWMEYLVRAGWTPDGNL